MNAGLLPFAKRANFLDPLLTDDGRPYPLVVFNQLCKERYIISKFSNTSYKDTADLTPREREFIIGEIVKEIKEKNEILNRVNNR